jgi:hypothetical protein
MDVADAAVHLYSVVTAAADAAMTAASGLSCFSCSAAADAVSAQTITDVAAAAN